VGRTESVACAELGGALDDLCRDLQKLETFASEEAAPAALDDFDMLSAIVDWVEKQAAPQALRATGRHWPRRRPAPLCPQPVARALQGDGGHRGRGVVRVPLETLLADQLGIDT